ncbi:MAG: signal recognition particle-docking protein FtsY [Pirellulaceae bacterium]|nr:signal recognition particle-docking protein FtsY [Pirellulaceae bacterium]
MAFWNRKKTDPTPATSVDPTQAAATPSEAADTSANANTAAKKSGGWLAGLRKTAQWLNTDIRDLWKSEGELVDDDFLQKLFAILVRSDMGGDMARTIRDRIGRDYRARKGHFEEMLTVISEEIRSSLEQTGTAIKMAETGPTVILVVGVNGSGKTTSIAKLAYRFHAQGKRVLLGAGDTFRAAAVEQLKIWSDRIGCDIVTAASGADPASVVFQTVAKAVADQYDVCILDTAGRLQTQGHLMQQLDKIRRVITKHVADAPHEVLLVLDATAGQNAISQAKGFSQAAGCTGIVLSKLDGSAKGGVIVPIRQQFNLPVKLVGLGEQLGDMAEFDPDSFTKGLFGEE